MSLFCRDRRSILCLLGLSLLTSLFAGCKKHVDAASAAAPPRVRFVHPRQTQVTDYEYFIGTMESVESIDVRARVTGYLQDIYFKDGDEVEKGASLYLIDPRPYQALVNQAKAQTLVAEARLKLAKADYDRGLAVSKTPGAISAQELETFAANVAQADATVVASKAAEESNKSKTRIAANVMSYFTRSLVRIVNGDAGTGLTVPQSSAQLTMRSARDHLLVPTRLG